MFESFGLLDLCEMLNRKRGRCLKSEEKDTETLHVRVGGKKSISISKNNMSVSNEKKQKYQESVIEAEIMTSDSSESSESSEESSGISDSSEDSSEESSESDNSESENEDKNLQVIHQGSSIEVHSVSGLVMACCPVPGSACYPNLKGQFYDGCKINDTLYDVNKIITSLTPEKRDKILNRQGYNESRCISNYPEPTLTINGVKINRVELDVGKVECL